MQNIICEREKNNSLHSVESIPTVTWYQMNTVLMKHNAGCITSAGTWKPWRRMELETDRCWFLNALWKSRPNSTEIWRLENWCLLSLFTNFDRARGALQRRISKMPVTWCVKLVDSHPQRFAAGKIEYWRRLCKFVFWKPHIIFLPHNYLLECVHL